MSETLLSVATATVLIANVALDFPLAKVTVAGTDTLEEELERAIFVEAGAGPLRVTVPVAPIPPTTVDGLIVTEVSAGGSRFRVPV